jgi:predicted site-specific integrase-resolvase
MTDPTRTPALVNETEAARRLGISVKTMRRWRWAGQGPVFTKLGGAVRYSLSDLEAFVAAGRRQSTAGLRRAA